MLPGCSVYMTIGDKDQDDTTETITRPDDKSETAATDGGGTQPGPNNSNRPVHKYTSFKIQTLFI